MKSPFSRFFGGSEKQGQDPVVEATQTNNEEVVHVAIEKIVPNRFQPRTVFDDAKIEELARTIHTHGVIQPIVIRKMEDNKYEIIAGERRFRAMSKLKWTEVPAIVRNLSDKETASIALIENLQREELTAIEEAVAYQKLLKLHELTQEALAQRLGKGQSTVANKLRLLKLPKEIQQAIMDKRLSERHARSLMQVKDEEVQIKLMNESIEQQWNVKQLEEKVNEIVNPPVKEEKNASKPKRKAISKDVRIALNTIKQSLSMVTKSGINLKTEEEDTEDFYQITVRIPKKKS
ncbi:MULTISPECIES: nucleoid occlusion protein [Psychrobacillus]|uniref:Nucleoid occlusion protein n=1 Tax=Psychrobacillus faecigallinarum TaxID=2762235 RepID=A0ABR8RAR4_9BACI|nr:MULTISPECIES: nucleoid occlusion protein [Psychrobacillus]MBD7944878.1 nucleoid occlusion protein [Psychrobacillus faecigallinarum]QEY21396.1 nucleoid occlusion protein [Psychrobacillus sp. AK 1817]QGM31907.1 nucleoid occlusion protein [Bacillus sp. N3536]